MLILFWVCLATVAYVYFGYPILLWLGILRRRQPVCPDAPAAVSNPMVSVIVPAHNEEWQIAEKLRNLLDSEYPRDQMEILIGSDGSSDNTENIVRQFAGEGVGLVSFPQQQGKSAMQNRLVAAASGEILVFTDADCFFAPDAIGRALENFADPRVGLVTARPRYFNERETATTENESLYLCYETWLRRRESERGLLAMASGSFVAMRRSVWGPLEPDLGEDFVLPLGVAQAGLLNILDEHIAVVTRLSQDQPGTMLRMKTRIISKDFRGLLAYARLLDPVRHGALAVSLWSHKLLRWLVPYFLLALMASNLFLLGQPVFRIFLSLQAGFYALALFGCASGSRLRGLPWSVPMSFCVVNLAALIGTLKCFARRTSGRWTPERQQSASIRMSSTAQSREFK